MTQDKQEISSGKDGFFEKDDNRISICEWTKYNGNSLTIQSDDSKGIERDKKRQRENANPIFVASLTHWTLTKGTKVVLRSPTDSKLKDEETIISEDTRCIVSRCQFEDKDHVICFVFKDICSWEFKPYIVTPRKSKIVVL